MLARLAMTFALMILLMPGGAQAQARQQLALGADECAILRALTGQNGTCGPAQARRGLDRALGPSRAAVPLGADETERGYFIRFAFNATEFGHDYKDHLNRLANVMKSDQMQGVCIHLVGHTDSVGRPEYNQGLSNRRAQAVQNYLRALPGGAELQMTAYGRGESQPLPDIIGEHPLNRRVEILAKPRLNGACS